MLLPSAVLNVGLGPDLNPLGEDGLDAIKFDGIEMRDTHPVAPMLLVLGASSHTTLALSTTALIQATVLFTRLHPLLLGQITPIDVTGIVGH